MEVESETRLYESSVIGEMDYFQAQRMIDAAVTKVRGSEVGAYLTVDHPNADVGFQFVMVGPDGRTNRLLASKTHQDRLDAHWGGFVDAYGAADGMNRKLKAHPAEVANLRSLYEAAPLGTWQVVDGGTAYYPLAIACNEHILVSFHSWDREREKKAAAIVELHNALPAPFALAESGIDLAAVRKLQSLHEGLPAEPWSVRQRDGRSAVAVLSGKTQVISFDSFEPAADSVANLVVQMHAVTPRLLFAAMEAALINREMPQTLGTTREYLFDAKLDASVRIRAVSECAARTALRTKLDAASANVGEILGQIIVCEVSMNDEPHLAEVDGEEHVPAGKLESPSPDM
ncbi:hypothetical protein [Caballeronia sordidicola]|uniref:hypothetical protein n=1 Tax=Caballeronia sordidicola TaxID=196367 RepID=UPI0004D0121E|nr:hypothetical protein [Caballeronia sordidicola]